MSAGEVRVPIAVLSAYDWALATVTPITGGLINATFLVRSSSQIAVLQRLHPVFGREVNLDIDAVTSHLEETGLATPRLIRTSRGDAWVDHEGEIWRALTYVEGETVHRVPSVDWAEAAGTLVGRVHRALADFRHDYAFARAGVHDTPAHLARLRDQLADAERGDGAALDLGREILEAAETLPELPATPRRHCHGDLKISNVLFRRDPLRAECLVDLDTVGLSTMAFELGDAMRSWCNPHGEDASQITFQLPIFAAAMRGFRAVADPIVSEDERRSIVFGLETVCIELSARFCVDMFRDDYFGWDPARFPSRAAHNLVRARGQLALGLAVRRARADALDIVLA